MISLRFQTCDITWNAYTGEYNAIKSATMLPKDSDRSLMGNTLNTRKLIIASYIFHMPLCSSPSSFRDGRGTNLSVIASRGGRKVHSLTTILDYKGHHCENTKTSQKELESSAQIAGCRKKAVDDAAAAFTMGDETYLESFIESIGTLPHDVRRNLELMKDLDKSCS